MLKDNILSIKDRILSIIKLNTNEKIWVDWYGAYDIDPKYLVFWICIQSDQTKKRLQDDVALMQELRATLQEFNYPIESQKHVFIGF